MGRINKSIYECKLMDGVKSNHSYPRIDYLKAWCGNRTVNRKSSIGLRLGGLYICAVGHDILKFEQTSLFYSA